MKRDCQMHRTYFSNNLLCNGVFLYFQIVDGYIGEVMNAFVEAEIFKETLFILVSDHGG